VAGTDERNPSISQQACERLREYDVKVNPGDFRKALLDLEHEGRLPLVDTHGGGPEAVTLDGLGSFVLRQYAATAFDALLVAGAVVDRLLLEGLTVAKARLNSLPDEVGLELARRTANGDIDVTAVEERFTQSYSRKRVRAAVAPLVQAIDATLLGVTRETKGRAGPPQETARLEFANLVLRGLASSPEEWSRRILRDWDTFVALLWLASGQYAPEDLQGDVVLDEALVRSRRRVRKELASVARAIGCWKR